MFVGRAAELAVLRSLVAAVAAGGGGVAWVEGEPGIGKSALVSQAVSGAGELGCAVFTGMADELRGRFPLGVMLDCLDVRSGLGAGERNEITRLLRGEGLGGMVPAGDAVVVAAERILGLVDQLCAASPVVLVVDDLQWADEVSVSVWHRLAAGVRQVPLLVIGVARPVPKAPGVAVARRGVMERGGVVLSLRPLPGEEVTAMVGGLVRGRPGPELIAQAAQAGGNPLYVRELTDALLREHRVRLHGGVAEITGSARGEAVSLAAAIEDRLGFVSAGTLTVLRAAALLGPRFAVRDLTVVAGRGARELTAAVAEAVAAGVLVESGLDLVFRHGLIQQALVEGMPAGLRAELHREAARALARAGIGAERVAAQLLAASADAETDPPDEWVSDWLAANVAALAHRAPSAAADLLARTAAGLTAGDERRDVLLEHLAWVLFLLSRYEEAEPVARELLAGSGDPARRGRMAWTLAYMLSWTGRSAEAPIVVDRALRDEDVPDVWRARLKSARAHVLLLDSRPPEAEAAVAEALAAEGADRFALGYALHVKSVLTTDDYDAALDLVDRALAVIGDDTETADLRLLLLSNRLGMVSTLDRAADTETRQLLALAEETGTARLGMIRLTVAQYLCDVGRWDDALAEAETLFEPGSLPTQAALLVAARGLTALVAAHRDDRAAAAAQIRAAERLPELHGWYRNYHVYLTQAMALAAERDGRPAEAQAILAAYLAGDWVAEETMEMEPWLLTDLVRCALAAGDRASAEAAAARCADRATRQARVGAVVAAARRCWGLVDGDPAPLEEAVAFYRSVHRPLELGQALEDLAVVRAAAGEVGSARASLGEAVEAYAGLGAEWDILRADTRLRPYGVRRRRPGARRPEIGWEALTPTEVKVAYLVAEGLSNPEIAARLFLSRYTVQVHVARILAKLQVKSRVEVAGLVARHPPQGKEATRSIASARP